MSSLLTHRNSYSAGAGASSGGSYSFGKNDTSGHRDQFQREYGSPRMQHSSNRTAAGSSTSSCYRAPWPTYALDWCKAPLYESPCIALGSFLEEPLNKLQILSPIFANVTSSSPIPEDSNQFDPMTANTVDFRAHCRD